LYNKGKIDSDQLDGQAFEEWAKVEARLTALEMVFQGDSSSVEALRSLRSFSENIVKSIAGVGFGGQFAAPFVRTPGNLLDIGTDYLPITGIVKNAARTAIEASRGEFNQHRFSQAAGRNITGLGLAGAALGGVISGAITGGDDDRTDGRRSDRPHQ
jgi:hypothetical protein